MDKATTMNDQIAIRSPADRSGHADLRSPRENIRPILKRTLAIALSVAVVLTNAPAFASPTSDGQPVASSLAFPQQSPAQLQQMVAPIALYPDPLVAQILAASTYSDEVVEADRWLQQHPGVRGQQLANEVDKQPWDPSVKALTEFPSVLANMDRNLSWTSSLGQAYVSRPQDVMNAVQDMRRRAQSAGNLNSTPQQNVTAQGQIIAIQPTSPDVVYLPTYDPWLVYGPPLTAWPGWYAYPGLYVDTPGMLFGLGVGIGLFGGFAWGLHHWGFNWAHRTMVFNHSTFISHRTTFFNHRAVFNRSAFNHHGMVNHGFIHGMHFNHGGAARYALGGRSGFAGGFHGGGRR